VFVGDHFPMTNCSPCRFLQATPHETADPSRTFLTRHCISNYWITQPKECDKKSSGSVRLLPSASLITICSFPLLHHSSPLAAGRASSSPPKRSMAIDSNRQPDLVLPNKHSELSTSFCARSERSDELRSANDRGEQVTRPRDEPVAESAAHLSLYEVATPPPEQRFPDPAVSPSVPPISQENPLEVLRSSMNQSAMETVIPWLHVNFEPWMLESFEHRLYERGAEQFMAAPAAFLSTREDISVEARLAAALLASAAEPRVKTPREEPRRQPVWMSALRGAMRAEARKAIVRVPEPGCDNILRFWNQLSEPDRRWAVGRLGAFDLYRRWELIHLGLIDSSEAVVIEALSAMERTKGVAMGEKIGAALEQLKSHASLHVRARMTRSPLIEYQWPDALRDESNPQVRRLLVRRAFEDLPDRALHLCLRNAELMDSDTVESVLYHATLHATLSSDDLAFVRMHPVDAVRAAAARVG
jgi:hypothetical protein